MAGLFAFIGQLVFTIGLPILAVRLLSLWLDRPKRPVPETVAVELPASLAFDWHRDYGPLWEPGSTAFWLEPEASDIKPGHWPMPFVKADPSRLPDIKLASPSLIGSYLTASTYSAATTGYWHPNQSAFAAYQNAVSQHNLANQYAQHQQSLQNGLQQAPLGSLANLLGVK